MVVPTPGADTVAEATVEGKGTAAAARRGRGSRKGGARI